MENLIFDAHAHYDDEMFDGDREQVIEALPQKNIFAVVNNGVDMQTSLKSIELAEKYPYFYAAVGIHPESVPNINMAELDGYLYELEELFKNPRVVALGETGLDYHWDIPKAEQNIVFEKQLQLSLDTHMPIVIHDREAHGDTMELLRRYKPHGLLHCYSGSAEMLGEVLRTGDMYISLGGVVTFKNARVPVEVAKEVPPDRLLLETDAPYMAPAPFRGKRCDSSLIMYTAQKIAEIKGISVEDLLKFTKENACRFYGVSST